MSNQLRLEKFQALFNCKYCFNQINDPIILPCGISVCKSHSEDAIKPSCYFCSEIHKKPATGFMSNEILLEMLDIEVNKLTFSPKFVKCKKEINKLLNDAEKIFCIQKDPALFIYEYFEDLKRQTDLRREQLKLQIDTYSDEMITEINGIQDNCCKMSNEINEINMQIDCLKAELDALVARFDSFEFDDEKYENILIETVALKPKIDDYLENYKNSLTGNKKYCFKFNNSDDLRKIYGSIMAFPVYMDTFRDSTIMTQKDATDLIKLCEFPIDQKWKLAYRATEDGFSSKKFHEKSIGCRNNLAIIKTSNGHIFGGYTDLEWKPEPLGYARDANAFLFSLVNSFNSQLKFNCIDPKNAIYRRPGFMLEFGNDLVVVSHSDENKCLSHLNERYQHPDMNADPAIMTTFLAGTDTFYTTEIELYFKV